MSRPLSGLRLVVTLPPRDWFGGVDHARARDQIAALTKLGASVYEFDVASMYMPDRSQLQAQIEGIRAFKPDAVIGTPHAGYAVQGGMANVESGRPFNIFFDQLDLPTVLYWDHFLTQAPYYILHPWPRTPDESATGALDQLRKLLAHPRTVHFFPDSGHIEELRKLGLAAVDDESWFVTAVSMEFVFYGKRIFPFFRKFEDDLAFFGNIYLAASKELPYETESGIRGLRDRALAACAANWNLPPYLAYRQAMRASPAAWLDSDQSFYWRFLYDELSYVANAEHRLRILTASNRPVAFYGGFADPNARDAIADAGCVPRGSVRFGGELAAAYERTRITLDVVNGPFIAGFSPKLLECFASGGFCLTTRRADIKRTFGDLGDAIGFSDDAELAAKIENFLTRSGERRKMSRAIREIILRNHTAAALFTRSLPGALERLRSR